MSFPDVSEVLPDFASSLTFRVARKQVKDGILTEKGLVDVEFEGVIEPIPPRKLLIKTEGERAWSWWTLWTEQKLSPDSIILDEDENTYRVVSKTDWIRTGEYFEYELTQGINE